MDVVQLLILCSVLTLSHGLSSQDSTKCIKNAKNVTSSWMCNSDSDDERTIYTLLPDGTLSIDLSNCKIQSAKIPTFNIDGCVISEINLYNNDIQQFQNDTFKLNDKLKVLNLSKNPFCYNTLPKNLFENLTSLTTLYLQPVFDSQQYCLSVWPEQIKNLTQLLHLHIYGPNDPNSMTYLSRLEHLAWLNLGEQDSEVLTSGCAVESTSFLEPLMSLNISRLSLRWCSKFNINTADINQTTVFRNLSHVDISYTKIGWWSTSDNEFSNFMTLFGPKLRVLLVDGLCGRQDMGNYKGPISNFNITTYSAKGYNYGDNYLQRFLFGAITFGEAFPVLRYLSTSNVYIFSQEVDISKVILNVSNSNLKYLKYWEGADLFTPHEMCPIKQFLGPSFNIFEENDLDVLPKDIYQDEEPVVAEGRQFPMLPSLQVLNIGNNGRAILNTCNYTQNNITVVTQSFPLSQVGLSVPGCELYTGFENVNEYYCENCLMTTDRTEQLDEHVMAKINIMFISKSYPNIEILGLKSSRHIQGFNPQPLEKLKTLILDVSTSDDDYTYLLTNLKMLVPAARTISFKKVPSINMTALKSLPDNLILFDLRSADIMYLEQEQRWLFGNHSQKQPNFKLDLRSEKPFVCQCNNTSLRTFLHWINSSTYVRHAYSCVYNEPTSIKPFTETIQKFLNYCKSLRKPTYWYLIPVGGVIVIFVAFLAAWCGRNSRRAFKIQSHIYASCCCRVKEKPVDDREHNTFFLTFLDGESNYDLTMALTQFAKNHFEELHIKAVSRIDARQGTILRFSVAQFISQCRCVLVLFPHDGMLQGNSQADIEFIQAYTNPLETKIYAVTNAPGDYLKASITELDDLSKRTLEANNLPILPLTTDEEACRKFWEEMTTRLEHDRQRSQSESTSENFSED